MNTKTTLLMVITGSLLLSACGNVSQALTQTKAIPDEFAVYTRAPLTMPPDYGVRPQPGPDGTSGTTSSGPQETARRVLLDNSSRTIIPIRAATPGTTALLASAGVHNADPNIRQIINRETTAYAEEDKTVIESMMFWTDPQTGTTVNAAEETKRIQENQALGKTVDDSNVPVIEPKRKAPLEGVFDGWFN